MITDVTNWHGWAGCKRRILQALFHRLPKAQGKFVVPFYGSGIDSVYAILNGWSKSGQYVLGDSCLRLVAGHRALVERDVDEMCRRWNNIATQAIERQHLLYQSEQQLPPGGASEPALTLAILTGMAWGCVYRENSRGEHNVPAKKRMPAAPTVALQLYQDALSRPGVDLQCRGYEETLLCAGRGDVVYADPPYVGTFSYGRRFDHEPLVRALRAAHARGARVFISGSDKPQTQEIYQPAKTWLLRNRDGINSRGELRRVNHELLMMW